MKGQIGSKVDGATCEAMKPVNKRWYIKPIMSVTPGRKHGWLSYRVNLLYILADSIICNPCRFRENVTDLYKDVWEHLVLISTRIYGNICYSSLQECMGTFVIHLYKNVWEHLLLISTRMYGNICY